ncbi:LOW QUALITY PROTEIN: protein-glucosylgalactosylhydroxylysine glucosidase-like [Ptychodera flava]|uniref:LOW QUALITY PROTEIN: protein-glucosylgalactosylhydroxylysine glucosidase-like n=1 Tax=Ptychodera flava TaxID=63121 RepID=UPI00396A4565
MKGSHVFLVLIIFTINAYTAAEDPTNVIKSNTLPDDDRFKPNIGNGHIGTSVLTDTVFVNGVMNGYLDDSHRARIQSTNALNVTVDGTEERSFELNMYEGVFRQFISHEDFDVEQRFYAHRSKTRLLVAEIEMTRNDGKEGNLTIDVELNQGEESPDFDMEQDVRKHDEDTWYTTGSTKEPETNSSEIRRIHIYWTEVPDSLTLENGQDSKTWTFISSISTDRTDALEAYKEGLDLAQQEDQLLNSHTEAWEDLWRDGRIEIAGNRDLGETLYAAMYYIISSTPSEKDEINPFIGLSPGGLPRGGKVKLDSKGGPYNDYAGHVFWDMDTWIMPPIMMFFPKMATRMIESRVRVLDVVEEYANETGYEGVRFPWEQCYTGVETCPWPPATQYQIHITADVSYSIRQYMYATMDKDLLVNSRGEELAMKIARFWESRSDLIDEDKGYEIYRVMGPDEYHENVNNSVFTNAQAKLSLQLPEYILSILDDPQFITEEDAARWKGISDNMFILFDDDRQYHPQFEGFDPEGENVIIKQSDVVLLGYPLMMNMTPEVRRNDLTIYENLTDEYGPDTGTWSMHTVGWLEFGEEDKADDMFKKMFRNLNGPFKIFSEKPEEGQDGVRCVNFITGAGGLLQSVVFGYGGLRLHATKLDIDPYVPKGSEAITFHGLNYRGCVFDMRVTAENVEITVIKIDNEGESMFVTVKSNGERHKLGVTDDCEFSRGKATIVISSDVSTSTTDPVATGPGGTTKKPAPTSATDPVATRGPVSPTVSSSTCVAPAPLIFLLIFKFAHIFLLG